MSDRLRSALQTENQTNDEDTEAETYKKKGIITTEEELEGYRIVKAIVCKAIAPERITERDTKTYFGVLLDDNNRKPICRLWFNSKQKYLGIIDSDKNETKIPLENVSDIYLHSDKILKTVSHYD